MAETVLYWAILKVVKEEKWKMDLGEDERELMMLGLNECVERGYLGRVILESRCGGKFRKNIMNLVAWSGHLDVVMWLHENRTEGCSYKAMDWAAGKGHLDVVKWLHENRTEGCSKYAMSLAAMHGHLDVVKWLHENRTEGCNKYAMDEAARNGYLDVAKWLRDNGYGN